MSHKEIHTICKKYNIKNYTINDDLSIDVNGDVLLNNQGLKELPLNFNKVTGNFGCHYNDLISLKGSPKEVGKSFHCGYNILKSLEYRPNTIKEGFFCNFNHLTTLEYLPDEVGQYISIEENPYVLNDDLFKIVEELLDNKGYPMYNDIHDILCRFNKEDNLDNLIKYLINNKRFGILDIEEIK